MENIGGRDVDFRKIQDIASESDGYRKNYVRFNTKNYSRADIDNLQEGNGGYIVMTSEAKKKASRYAKLALAYKRIADKEDDVKDDEGKESDGEFMRIDKHGDEWLVHVDKEPEQKFDSLHEALDYVMTVHGDERFEEDDHDEEEDKKKEEEARRAARLTAIYRARKASGINVRRAQASRVIASPVNDDRAGRGLYK